MYNKLVFEEQQVTNELFVYNTYPLKQLLQSFIPVQDEHPVIPHS